MIKFYILLIIGCLIGFNVVVLVEIVNFINSVDGVNCDVGIMVVKKKFQDVCIEWNGLFDVVLFEVVFEKISDSLNVFKLYYVDGKMKCMLFG